MAPRFPLKTYIRKVCKGIGLYVEERIEEYNILYDNVVWTSLTMLMDAGKFKLDDNIEAALPAAFNGKLRNLNHPSVPITYRMLYTHTTGLKDEFKGYLYVYTS